MAFRYTTMAPLALILALLSSVAFVEMRAAANPHLKLTAFGPKRVKGTYQYNELLGIKFDIRPLSMEMKTLNESLLASYMKLDNSTDYFQITDQGFVSEERTSVRAVPKEVPKTKWALSAFANQKPASKEINPTKAHEAALGKLQHFEEVQFLEAASEALANAGGSGIRLQTTETFHLMCLNLINAMERAGKPVQQLIDEALRKSREEAHDRSRTKRCTSLENNHHNNCFGMCGRKCSCWKWVCGDCCYHRGCEQHDYCCKKLFLSPACLLPWNYVFTCAFYGGYHLFCWWL